VVFEFGIDLNKGLCVYLFDFFFVSYLFVFALSHSI